MGRPRKINNAERGAIDVLRSGRLRVRVYAGVDPISKRDLYLVETVPPGPNAQRQAEKVRTRLLSQVDERRNPRTKATLNYLLDRYLDVANLGPGTLRGYRRNIKNHVKPLIGSTKISAIDAHILDKFYAELRRCRVHCDGTKRIDHRTNKPHSCDHRCGPHECHPLAPSTVRRIHFLLSGAFKRAVRWGWLSTNPASTAEPPPEPKPNPQPPIATDAARILNAAWEDPDWHAFVWLAMTTGSRRAELCALRWRHVDLRVGTLSVYRSIDQDGSETSEKDTKTHQHRRIALNPETVAVLSAHKVRCEERAATLETKLTPDAFIFSLAPDGSVEPKPDTMTQRYGRLADRLGINTTLHKLRHYSATELISAGVDVRTVGGRLGHGGGGSTTLKVYSAWVAESDQRASTTLSARMPARPDAPFDRAEFAKTEPQAPYEKIAAKIRQQVLDGTLAPGSPAPTQKSIAETHHVSAGTANRVVELLKTWQLIDTSRGRRAVVLQPPENEAKQAASIAESASQPAQHGQAELLELSLLYLGETVRTFTAEADTNDPAQLRLLLTTAARRHAGKDVDVVGYELEVRQAGSAEPCAGDTST
ncbi:MAG: tyrosine-type recombinase/integrase [Pseudonocardiaceae bacterium]|nr:tyrosine-type recombinase/integrase [Pseudonocardiaceae bacterium]